MVYNKRMSQLSWYNPTQIHFGSGKLAMLGSLIEEQVGKNSKVFLVTGTTFLKRHGILERIFQDCSTTEFHLFDKVLPYPSPELVDQAITDCRYSKADIVVAIGGGSALDLAKVVATLAPQEGLTMDYLNGVRVMSSESLPFIAIPTTSGSSSEVTPFAPLWDMEKPQKLAFSGQHMFPTIALLDPDLALTMPKKLAAATGMDAFTSAFESYWSTDSHPMSEKLNLEVIRLFKNNLVISCTTSDKTARSNCAYAATISGVAYSNVRPNVCHALGVPLSLIYNMDHGESVGITLPLVLRAVAPNMPDKMEPLLAAFNVNSLDGLLNSLVLIMKESGLRTSFEGMNLTEPAINRMLEFVEWERLLKSPTVFNRQSVKEIFMQLL